MSEILLGKEVEYKSIYDKSLLFPISRSLGRNKINLQGVLPFSGYDLWNCYEVSWLNIKGKPEVRIMHFIVPAESEYLVESKSIKLYLNSFNNTKFSTAEEVKGLIQTDLSQSAGAQVEVIMHKLNHYKNKTIGLFDGICLDDLDVEISDYSVNSDLLKAKTESHLEHGKDSHCEEVASQPMCQSQDVRDHHAAPKRSLADNIVSETLYSNLLKSNCLVTGQPDWASIEIKYSGQKINHEALLKYIISYRNHNGFHEECIEHIFMDILNIYQPKELSIFAKYTRRGGVDINPFRTNLDLKNTEINKIRDVRQ